MDIKGSHTSVRINSKHSLALYPLAVKVLLVTLPFIQDLQIGRSSGIKEGKIPDLASFGSCLD